MILRTRRRKTRLYSRKKTQTSLDLSCAPGRCNAVTIGGVFAAQRDYQGSFIGYYELLDLDFDEMHITTRQNKLVTVDFFIAAPLKGGCPQCPVWKRGDAGKEGSSFGDGHVKFELSHSHMTSTILLYNCRMS